MHYKQITNIDLSGIAWTGLGGQEGENPFKGIYDGNNKSIYNVNFSCADKNSKYRALFASTSNATIKNLTIEVGNKHVASDGTITYTGNGFADDMVEGCTFGGAPLAGYFGSGSKAINITTKGVLGAEGEYGKDVPNHNIAGLVVLAVSDNDKGLVEFENCRSEVKLIAGYTKAGGLVTYTYDYGYP